MRRETQTNGAMWYDDTGAPIQAHGGCILPFGGRYYWYGEHKGAPNVPGTRRVDVIGISCYSSVDLVNWHYEGLALPASPEAGSPLHPSRVVERPKALYCAGTGKFVLWFHADTGDYRYAGVGVAAADSPTGPFTMLRTFRPGDRDSRDMTVWQEENGAAWLYFSTDMNQTMGVARLTDDYTDITGEITFVLVDQAREAPALCQTCGRYFMVTSGCTGWDPNSALYAISSSPRGPWRLIDNPLEGDNCRRTFEGQSTLLFTAEGQTYLMLDHWKPQRLSESGYTILPANFPGGSMRVLWAAEWRGIGK